MCGDSLDLVAQAVLPGGPEQPQSLADAVNSNCCCPQPPTENTDTVTIYQGNVLTMARGKFSPAEAFAVRNGVIISVGSLAEVRAAIGVADETDQKVQVVDYTDKFIMPGFIDPHLHLLLTTLVSIPNYLLDFSYPKVQSLDDALGLIKAGVAAGKPGDWVFGFGYDPSLTEGHEDLTLADLDTAAPENLVYVVNQSGHVGYVNTLGFRTAGIGIKATDPG